jgi:hypothetical protein
VRAGFNLDDSIATHQLTDRNICLSPDYSFIPADRDQMVPANISSHFIEQFQENPSGMLLDESNAEASCQCLHQFGRRLSTDHETNEPHRLFPAGPACRECQRVRAEQRTKH